jgi:phosphate starvation-inducible protein PhoH
MAKKTREYTKRDKNLKFLQQALEANGAAQHDGPKRKHWNAKDLKLIKPITSTQEDLYHAWYNGKHIVAHGVAGSGKTFVSLYLAFQAVLEQNTQKKIIIVRSAVPTRDLGFLPGDLEEKIALYETPYHDMCYELFEKPSTYDDMKDAGLIQFMPTSFIRGLTWDNAVIIIDEFQNMNWMEFDSVITRVGENSRVFVCGDHLYQRDLKEKSCVSNVLDVCKNLKDWATIEFSVNDIVRSGFVKNWIMCRTKLGI